MDKKPCPFCGSVELVETWTEDDKEVIMCDSCGACGPTPVELINPREESVKLWNARKDYEC